MPADGNSKVAAQVHHIQIFQPCPLKKHSSKVPSLLCLQQIHERRQIEIE
jgi:hypothetical protein